MLNQKYQRFFNLLQKQTRFTLSYFLPRPSVRVESKEGYPMTNTRYITVNHLCEYDPLLTIRPGEHLTLKKDTDNPYDDEAIAVFRENRKRCGWVANSVSTVARGTSSAGRIYDHITNGQSCIVRFLLDDSLIAEILEE